MIFESGDDGKVSCADESASVIRAEIAEGPDGDRLGRILAERELESSRNLYHSLVESVPYAIFRKDCNGRYTFGNQRYCQLHGLDLVGLVGKTDYDLYPAELARKYREDDRRTTESREVLDIEEEHQDPIRPGERQVVHTIKCPVYDAEGRPAGIQGMFADITTRRMHQAQLEHLATHDLLTGLSNRVLFYARLDEAIIEATASRSSFSIFLIDLDRFKEINDTLGHHYGDLVLQCVGQRFRAGVEPGVSIARLGGDEFGIVIPGCDRDRAARIAGRLIESLLAPIHAESHTLGVGASVGIAMYPEHGTDRIELVQHADIAMYDAKKSKCGPNFYDVAQATCTPERLALASDLRDAAGTEEFVLYYQPKIDLGRGLPCGAEALMRWQHPRYGLIAPERFISMAERIGFIERLDLWAIASAMGTIGDWGWDDPAQRVAVNLSAATLQGPKNAELISRAIKASGQPPQRVQVEVTESSIMDNPRQARKSLDRLHEMGVTIAIDDFGTGYSSLAYLKNLPVDEVKIDQSFVRDMTTFDRDACIVRAIIDLGHNLGLRVTAEGVEDAATLAKLADLGCDFAQGYHIGRPLHASEYQAWLASSPCFGADLAPPSPDSRSTSRTRRRRRDPGVRRRIQAIPGRTESAAMSKGRRDRV